MDTLNNYLHYDKNTIILATFICIAFAAYRWQQYKYNYWTRLGVKSRPPKFIVSELVAQMGSKRAEYMIENVKKYGRVHGMYFLGAARLVVADPEVAYRICVKDFDAFPDHRVFDWSSTFSKNFLVWLKGDHWKRVRALMSPSFTSSKIKRMYKLLDVCVDDFVECIGDKQKAGEIVDLIQLNGLFTMDATATCLYGLRLKREQQLRHSGGDNANTAQSRDSLAAQFHKMLKVNWLRFIVAAMAPKVLLKMIKFQTQPTRNYQGLVNTMKKLIETRRQASKGTNKCDDILQSLVDANIDDKLELSDMDAAENHHAGLTQESLKSDQDELVDFVRKSTRPKAKLSDLEILSEALLLMATAFDTTRVALSLVEFTLAHHPQVQQRLYAELSKLAKHGQRNGRRSVEFDYEALTGCHYLDAVISETLRLFPPALATDRQAARDYFIEKYKTAVPNGTTLFVSIGAMQRDPEYWNEPDKFDPDRFMPGQRENIVPGSYMPFGIGPRHCIGMRFSLTEQKLCLAKVVLNYKLEVAPNTTYPPELTFGGGISSFKNCRVCFSPRPLAN